MDEVSVEKKELLDMSSLINGMQVNTYYNMPPSFLYKWIKIDYGAHIEKPFSWSMAHNYDVTHFVGYCYPLNGQYVTHFKTEAGAKRNLIKRFKKP